jgi:sugar lactone lactonase YvrE
MYGGALALSPDGAVLYALRRAEPGKQLTAWDARNGAVLWEAPSDLYFDSPLVDNEGNVYCTVRSQRGAHLVVVVRSYTQQGQLRWESRAPVGLTTNLCMSAQGHIFAYGKGDSLLCFDCQGSLCWAAPMLRRPELGAEGGVRLVLDSEGVVYACYSWKYLLAFDAAGNSLFTCELPGIPDRLSGVAIPGPDKLIVVGEYAVYCIE